MYLALSGILAFMGRKLGHMSLSGLAVRIFIELISSSNIDIS